MFSPIFLSGVGGSSASTAITVAIAALVCVLIAEAVGIYMLITKLSNARKARKEKSHRHYGMGVFLLAGAVGQASYTALTVLSVLAGLGALALIGLVVATRVMGYGFVSAKTSQKKAEEPSAVESMLSETEPTVEEPVVEYPVAEEIFEEEMINEEAVDEEPYEEIVDEEIVDAEEYDAVAESEEEADAETVTEEVLSEEAAAESIGEETPLADEVTEEQKNDAQPYRVVEKVVTETVKEVYKEAPQQASGVNDSVVEKLVDLLDYELRTRRELELADAAKKAAEGSLAVAAVAAVVDEDEDDDEADEADEATSDANEEIDEENDPESDRFTGNERIIGFNEVTGCYIVAHYRKSFEAKLIQARPEIKQYYSELKNALLSYKGTKNRISWTADSFHNGRTTIAKINVKTRILELYLALDPASLEGTVYRGKDVSDKKKYADTPFQYKLRTPRKFKWAMELVQRVCEEKGLTPIDIEKVDYEAQYPFDTTENLVERKLIKEYIREEKPASSFELDPDHVPEALTEDETVIPANANFSWEFDNERMVDKEPEPIVALAEEPLEEASAVEEVLAVDAVAEAEPAAVAASDVVRETVKVTETRYTERYYADKPCEEEVIVSEPSETVTEAVEEPTEESVADAENTAEDTAEESSNKQDSLRTHEVVYAADDSYGSDAEYAPVAVSAEQNGEEYTEETDAFEDDDEPLFGNAFEEVPYEETPFEYDLIDEQANENSDGAGYFEEEPVENELFYEESEETEAYSERSETQIGDAFAAEEVQQEPEEESGYSRADTAYRPSYGDSYGEHPFEETYAQAEPEVQPTVAPAAPIKGKFNPSVAVIDICSVEAAFRAGEVISLETLKERGLILSGVTVLKIYTSGNLGKAFTVEAHQFTVDAIRAISDAHGNAIMVR